MAKLAKLTASAPVLLVKDVVAGANYYRDKMGFSYDRFWGEPPSFVILYRDGMYVMLRQAADPKHVVPHWTVSDKLWNIYFWVSDVKSSITNSSAEVLTSITAVLPTLWLS